MMVIESLKMDDTKILPDVNTDGMDGVFGKGKLVIA